ncbi:Bug family tripartite tricarboxylate transporter substrate binding protein [Rubritepida flocculans]|uniref:Bug family tripartite tricarboxylate transporter substrate binding protein n=1 Tax=Rubritepida flocculans TaxID=182403 RepID=UPI000425CF9F|nr:tripartite tricarboxylate transporter substrate-binding protein [Rubritepida flocculans]
MPLARRALFALPALLPAPLRAQPRGVTLIVPFAPGGTTDIAARLIQEALGRALGAPVVVENRPGAGGAVAAEQAKRAPADGGVILLATASTHGVNPAVFPDLPYDAERDFAPVALLGVTPQALAVNPRLPVTDVAGFIALLRAEPGRHNFASAGVGSITHLAGEWFRQAGGGLDFVHVPYRGGGPALQAVVAGEASFTIETTATLAGAIRDGRVRALAVATREPSRAFPDLPTLHESGLAGFNAGSWTMAVAPAATPAPVVMRLNAAFNAALAEREVARRLAEIGTEPVTTSTPESAAAHIRAEIARWREVVRAGNLRLERG